MENNTQNKPKQLLKLGPDMGFTAYDHGGGGVTEKVKHEKLMK